MSLEFNVVRFTPDPEEVEPVNVALLFWGDLPRVMYDEAFPRLRCIAPYADTSLVRFYLDDLGQQLTDVGRARDYNRASLSSQFQISAPKQMTSPLTDAIVRALRDKYLRIAPATHASPATSMLRMLDSDLDALLAQMHVPPSNVIRKASPKDFLAPETNAALGGNGILVARAIRGQRHLVLIDSVNLSVRQVDKVELRAQHIAAAFFKIGQVRDDLLRIERRQLVRATVVFGRPDDVRLRRYAARLEYLSDMLRRESDFVEDGDAPSAAFAKVVAAATPSFH